MSLPKTSLLLALLATAGLVPAQTPTPLPAEQRIERPAGPEDFAALRDATTLTIGHGTGTAGGWDYQATFGAEGTAFVPALGSTAPTTQHLRLRPQSIRRGQETVVTFDGALPAPVALADRTVAYPHRGDLSERYAVTPQGLALSWHFARPLGTAGDLVVRYQLDTSLPLPATGATDGLAFTLPKVGGVRIGGVTGIDARGQQAAGELRLDGAVLELRLPAAFVDRASHPLVLDPLIGTQFLAETGGWNDNASDAAYDATNDVYLVVYRRAFSATSVAIRAQRISGAGTLVGGFLAIASGANVGNPTVANLGLRDTFVVAWQQAASTWEPFDLNCCSVNAANGSTSATVTIAGGTGDEIDPDAAGDPGFDDEALIAYTVVGAGIRIANVTVASQGGVPALLNTTTVTADATAELPAISKSPRGLTAVYVVAWKETSGSSQRVQAQAMNRDGVLQGAQANVTNGSTLFGLPGTPDIDGDGTDFVVVYDYQEGGGSFERNVWCRGLRWSGGVLSPSTTFTPLDTRTQTDQRSPAVAFCRYRYMVFYADQLLPGSFNYDIRGIELGANCQLCGTLVTLTGVNGTALRNVEWMPAVCSQYAGTDSDLGLLTFTESDDSPPFTSSLIAQRLQALGSGGAITLTGSACGAGGTIGTAGGPFAIGNTDFLVTLSGAQPSAVPFVLLGFPGGEQACGACLYTNPVASVFVLPSGGNAAYNWRIPCAAYQFLGMQVQAQWALVNTSANPCFLLSGLSFSQRVRLTLGL